LSFTLTLSDIGCVMEDRVLFAGMTAKFSSGELIQILGPNGAGKTTLLKILIGLSRRYDGTLSWCGGPLPSYDFYASMLYVGHNAGVKTSLTPLENLIWYFGLNGCKGEFESTITKDGLRAALQQVGLVGYENVPVYQMSAGQKRRVALARLYVSQAPLWILDEPFTAIDRQGVLDLEKLFAAHRQKGGVIILTSHQDMSQAQPKIIDLAKYSGRQG